MSGLSVAPVLALARRRVLALAALLLLALFATGQVPASKGRPLTREEVAVVWIGISQDELYLLRVELGSNGQGMGADSFRGEEPRVFRVASWDYRPPVITIQTEAVGDEGIYELGTLRGEITGVAMRLAAAGDGWRTEYELRREAELERRWTALKTAMSETSPGTMR